MLPAQNATGNWVKVVQRIPVRLDASRRRADAPPLRAGMSVDVEIDTGHQPHAAATSSIRAWRWIGGETVSDWRMAEARRRSLAAS